MIGMSDHAGRLKSDLKEFFRIRRSLLPICIVVSALSLAGALAYANGTLPEPAKHGIKNEHSSALIVFLAFGAIGMLGVYGSAACFLECVTIVGTSISVRSVFQKRQFDASEVTRLTWNTRLVGGGRLDFRTSSRRTKLDLHGYRDEDRLRLVRLFRGLIPQDKQVDWPPFCRRIAVPLRDRRLSPNLVDPALAAARGEAIITRRRYDRLAMVLLPSTLFVAFMVWWMTTSPMVFVILACLAIFWVVLRFSVRRQGELQARLTLGSRAMLFGMSGVIASAFALAALRSAGFSRDTGCFVALLILGPTLPFLIYGVRRADRQLKREAEAATALALERWQIGERTCPQSHRRCDA
jgi:hypothetical protein